MFFILSKVLAFLICPFLYAFVLLALGIFLNKPKWKRKCLLAGFIILWIFSTPLLLNLLARAWDVAPETLQPNKTYSAAIVLGGFSGDDKNGKGSFNWAADRFIQGVMLQKTGVVKKILISSGNGNLFADGFKEADWAKSQLTILQVPDSCILIENQSRNTRENASYSKQLLVKEHQKGPYLLVTSAFHMRRSLQIFRKQGVEVIPYSCNYVAGDKSFSFADFVPSADVLGGWNIYIKEIIGVIVNKITGKG
ncbi:YdcF family protein [Mucilaginibacter flavus]|uniref:YdcF family protein n=1 Tax=Mucilaginibacter flavus TaxID=931504 RepID=UPI0025B2B707|nr:YdcF family protein [Mucilaginibacter flavus]MDN3580975.1 YdcF family protein [Mucilaginibacter flavus]